MVDDEDGEADRGLGGGDSQHEHGEDLAGHVVEEGREGDEIDVHREQDQLDRHQDDDHVLPVQEDAEHAEHEQDRADGEVVAQADHSSTPCPTPGCMLRTASFGRRRTWRSMLCGRTSLRLRWVSTIAPIIATSRTMPAASKMNR